MPRPDRARNLARPLTAAVCAVVVGCGGDAEDAPMGAAPPAPGVAVQAVVTPTAASAPGAAPAGPAGTAAAAPGSDRARGAVDFPSLVPSDAVAYFECTSLDELEVLLSRLCAISSVLPSGNMLATLPLVAAGVDPAAIDRHAPLALAFAPAQGHPLPMPLVIVPAGADAPLVASAAALAARGVVALEVGEGYFVVQHGGHSTRRGGAAVTADLPAGLVRGRIRTDLLAELAAPRLFRCADMLNEAYRLAQPKASARELHEFDANEWLEEIRASRELALGLALDGDHVVIDGCAFGDDGAAADHCRATTVRALGHHLHANDPFSVLVSFDPTTAFDDLVAAWERADLDEGLGGLASLLGRARPDGSAMATSLEAMLDSFHDAAVVAVELEPAKAHVAFHLTCDEPERAREAVSLMLSRCELETWGFEMALPLRSMHGTTLVEDYSVRFDTRRIDFDERADMREAFKTFLGDSVLHLKVATSGRHVLIVLGGDNAAVNGRIRAFAEEGVPGPAAGRALEAVTGGQAEATLHGVRIVRADLVQLFGELAGLHAISRGRSVADAYRDVMRSAGDGQAAATVWTWSVPGGTAFGATFEIEAIPRAFDAFKGSGL